MRTPRMKNYCFTKTGASPHKHLKENATGAKEEWPLTRSKQSKSFNKYRLLIAFKFQMILVYNLQTEGLGAS